METLTGGHPELDQIDSAILALFSIRLQLAAQSARADYINGRSPPPEMDSFKLQAAADRVPPSLAEEAAALQATLLELSRCYQERMLKETFD